MYASREEIEFNWGDPDMNIDKVFRPGVVFPASIFNIFEMSSTVEKLILIHEEQENVNFFSSSSNPRLWETNPPLLWWWVVPLEQ